MVEKEALCDEESTVMVDAIVNAPPSNTVGVAIRILEAKLAEKGFDLKCLPLPGKSEFGKVDGELLRLPNLITLAIAHGIDMSKDRSEESVGLKWSSPPLELLVPGNVVAL